MCEDEDVDSRMLKVENREMVVGRGQELKSCGQRNNGMAGELLGGNKIRTQIRNSVHFGYHLTLSFHPNFIIQSTHFCTPQCPVATQSEFIPFFTVQFHPVLPPLPPS